MNRRGFISLMLGAAGAPLVPWRGLVAPFTSLPARAPQYCTCTSTFCNRLHKGSVLTQESLEWMLRRIRHAPVHVYIRPTELVISPSVKRLIDTDPVVHEAYRRLAHGL